MKIILINKINILHNGLLCMLNFVSQHFTHTHTHKGNSINYSK